MYLYIKVGNPTCGSPVSPEEGTRESTNHNTFNHLHIGAQVQPHARTRRPHTRSALPEFPFACWHKQPHAYACHSCLGRTLPSLLTAHWAQVLMLRQEMSMLINSQDTPTRHPYTSHIWPWPPDSHQPMHRIPDLLCISATFFLINQLWHLNTAFRRNAVLCGVSLRTKINILPHLTMAGDFTSHIYSFTNHETLCALFHQKTAQNKLNWNKNWQYSVIAIFIIIFHIMIIIRQTEWSTRYIEH